MTEARWTKRRIAVIAALGVVSLGAIGALGGQEKETPKVGTGPGAPEVYTQIAAETDCAALQGTFDRAADTSDRGGQWRTIGLGYMDAADARLRELGCYR